MIDYSLFHFSCPPRTGTSWILRAAELVGLKKKLWENEFVAHVPFDENGVRLYRVSLVRHPCDYLASRWTDASLGGRSSYGSFDSYIRRYLSGRCEAVSHVYARYKADSCMRIEDMPWAFMEFLQSIDVPPSLYRRCEKLGKQNVSGSLPQWDRKLRQRIVEMEKEVCEAYEYY